MARFKIISKDGSSVKYEGKLRYIGSYLKPSYVEFSEISSPTPINWEIGDYVDYSRTGMRYRLFSVPQVVKNARAGSHGSAFSYTNVQFFAATKELEIALFRDLVSGDNNIHFSTSPDVATFEDVAGIARRIQACMDDLYPGKWVIKVADFDAESDAEVIEKITTAKDFALSGGTCLDALSKIYELWQDIGWIHSYDPTREKDIITIGYANKRIDANTTDAFLYGKGNGLTAIKKSQANKEEFATRLYVYGSERNLPSRYYNDKDILNAESVDIRNLMLPMDVWGRTDGKPDARKAYIENAEAVAKIGVIPRVHYFDSDESGADIYPSIEGMTVGMLRKVLSDMGDTAYSPSYGVYTDASERVDEVGGVISLPTDEGKISEAIELTTISIPSFSKTKNTGIVESVDLIENHILYEGLIKSSFEMGEITVKPSLECTVTDADFSSVVATLTLDDSLGASTSSPSKTISIPAEYDESRNLWVLPLKDISVKFDRKTNSNGFYIYLYVTISATKNTPGVSNDAVVSIYRGTADVEVKQVLSKTFNIRLKQIGFNLNLQADLGQGKTISMKTGKCAGRNFVISSARYSPSSDSWDITCKRQQDETLGLLFPNTNYEIQAGDRFVLLDIVMPESYIRVAMERLLAEGQRLFNQVSTVRSNYEPSIDAKLMAESGRHLREGMFMEISDSDIVDNTTEHILIDTLSIYEDESAIPIYKVTLRERRKVTYKGTPSAAATTKTSSVEDGETDMSEYAKTAYVDKKDKEFSSTLSKILDWFTLEDDVLLTKYNLASEKEVSAKGINASQGGGTSYNRLDSWSAYDSSKAGYVLSALLGYDLHSRVTALENAEVDLSDYYTKSQTDSQIASAIGAIDLNPYATKAALNILEGKHNTLRNEFDALNNLLSSDTTDYINTWNEVVAFLDGYKDESDLATILSGMNADISSRLLTSTFESWKADTYTPLANLVANHTTRLDGLDQSILSINTRIDGVDKTIEDHIAEFIAFRANFEISDDLILVRKNFASTEEVSAKGINQGAGGGGGSSYSRLDTWEGYDNNKAGYVLSAGLGYGLKVAIDELNGYNLNSRLTTVESNYLSKNGGVATNLTVYGGTINGDFIIDRSISTILYYKDGVRLGFMGFRDELEPIIYDAAGHYSYDILHSGNIGSQSVAEAQRLVSPYGYPNYVITNATTADSLFSAGYSFSAMQEDHPLFGYATIWNFSAYQKYGATQLAVAYNAETPRMTLRNYCQSASTWSVWREVAFLDSNVASADYATTAGNANTVGGWASSYGSNKPFGTIPTITTSGYMDIGGWLEFHYDNYSELDFSTILMCTGNYQNVVYLPSASGTLALLTDNVASAQALMHSNGTVGATVDVYGGIRLSTRGIWSADGGLCLFDFNNTCLNVGYSMRHSYITDIYGSAVRFLVGDTPRMLVNSIGNVTIGDADYAGGSYKLYIDRGRERIAYDLGGNIADFINYQHASQLEVGRKSDEMVVAIAVTDDHYGVIQSKGLSVTSTGKLSINPMGGEVYIGSDSWGNFSPTLTVTNNVGIGNPSPSYKLDVTGDIRATESITIGGATLSWENGALKVNTSFYSEKEISAKGLSTGGGSGASYNRLDAWGDYDSSKSGYVLSALLGYDLNSRLTTVESNYLSKNGGVATNLTVSGGGTAWINFAFGSTDYGSFGINSEHDIVFHDTTQTRWLLHTGNIGDYALKTDGSNVMTGSLNFRTDTALYRFANDSSGRASWYNGSVWKTLAFAEDVLSTSGGTINSNTYDALIINSSYEEGGNGNLRIRFDSNNVHKGFVGWNVDGTILYNYQSGHYIGIADDGTPHYNGKTLIHSSNIGSQSVAYASNAGTLAGISLSNGSNTPWGTIPKITEGGWMDVGKYFEFHYDNTTGSDYSTILSCTGNHGNFVSLPSASGTLALTTDNVASATKLATARTIWGQSFDGTGNVGGHLSDVTFLKIRDYDYGIYKGNYFGGLAASDIVFTAPNLYFYTSKFSMLINTSGNVTIGASDLAGTSARLYVDGRIYAETGFFFNGDYGIWKANKQTANAGDSDILYYAPRHFLVGGNVLIGTTEDNGAELQVNGEGYFSSHLYTKNWVYYRSYKADGTPITLLGITGDNMVLLNDGDSSVKTVIGGGNVGIGGITPQQPLHVNGVARVQRRGTESSYLDITVGDVVVTYNGYDSDGFCSHSFRSNDTDLLYLNGHSNDATFYGSLSVNSTLSVANTISSADSITTSGGHVSAYNGFLINNQNKFSGLVPNSRISGGGNATDVWMYVEAGKAIILGESGIDLRTATTISSTLSVSDILSVGNASIHPANGTPYFQLYQNNNYWYWQADNSYTYIGGTMSKALRIDQSGNVLVIGTLGADGQITANNGLSVSKGLSASDGIVSDWITAANITANTSATIAALTVSGLSTFTGGVVTNDIHGNGQSLYLGNASNNAYIKVREDMQGSSSMWSIPRDGRATFTSLTTPTLSVTGSATIASVAIEAGNATLSNLTVNTAATLKQLVVGIDGISCNGPATFNDFIYGSSITPKTDNYYVLGNNNYKWYGVTAYNVNVHEAITIEAGKELRFKDDNGVVHTLKYDSAKQAFVFDGNVNATGEMSAKKLNA